MKLSWQETEILQHLSKGATSVPAMKFANGLASNSNSERCADHGFSKALESLKAKGFVEVAENGTVLITDMGNAALASL